MTNPTIPSRVPAGATPEADGIVVGTGPVRVDLFIDLLCPYCRQFELAAEPTLADLVAKQAATLVYHPMNFLDAASTTNYSTRAAAASGCAADQGRFMQYVHALYEQQPPEGGAGLSDDELVRIGLATGLDESLRGCVSGGAYLDWPPYVTDRATAAGVEATPTVAVERVGIRPDPETLAAAVARARAARR